MSTPLIQTETPIGGIEENDDAYLERSIDELVIWLKKNAISSDGIRKICKTLSFKRIQTISKHDRSLSKLSADALNLSLMDKIGFLDGIEDLRKQNSPHLKHVTANPNILNPLNEQELHNTQLVQNYICTLDNNYKTQKENINKAFMENMLKQSYRHNKHKLNSNDINQFDKFCQLTFSMNYDHKTDIIQSITSIGNINGIGDMPILNIKNITSNCIDIDINDEDLLNKEDIFKYEIQFSKASINVDNEMNDETDINDVIWTTQVMHSDKNSFSLQNLESNRSYLIRMKKTHICNNQSVITDLIRGHTLLNYDKILYKQLIELKLQNVSNDDMLAAAQQFNDVNDAVNYLLSCNNNEEIVHNNCEEIDDIDSKQEFIDNDELKNETIGMESDTQLLCWDKIRHGLNVNFLNDYCVQTGEFCLVICNDGIDGKMVTDFIWEITVDRLSKDSTFIGYINGPITNINLNSCLTAGKQNSKTQFAVAFNNGFDEGTLFGIYAKKRKIKLKSAARKGDRFMFHINFEKKEVALYQNDKRVGVIFTNVSDNIVPAVSGRGGKYTIKTVSDLSVIEEPKSNGRAWWWARKSNGKVFGLSAIHRYLRVHDDLQIDPQQTENQTDENVTDDYIDGAVSIQSEEQIFSADIITAPLKSTETLLSLANQFKSNETLQTVLSTDPNLLVEYTTGNESNESSVSPSSQSGESKRNSDDENGNNDNNHNDEQDDNERDENDPDENDNNANEKCTIHEYGCNVSWHAVRLKQLEDENRQLKLLLQKQTDMDEIDNISQPYDNNFEEKKQSDLLNTSLNLKIAAKLTKKTIPDNADETFNDVFDYMSKYTHIYHENAIKDYKHQEKEIKVIDYGIHCKKTQKTIYAICEKKKASNNVETVWKTNDNLYSDCELEQMYKIPKTNLSFPVTISDTIAINIKNAQKQITHILQNKTQRNNIIGHKKTPWANEDKIPIINKKSKQNGLTLVLEKHEFVQQVEIFANKNVNNIKLVPIVRFNNANEYFYEIVWIVEIGKHINIGISFMHTKHNGYIPSAIYLDVHDQHKLVAYTHNCKCLESFNCIIDRLQIGDSKETRMHKRYKSKMRKKMKENENQMQNYLLLREQDMLVINDIKKTCKNLQNDLQSLLERQSSLNQQQIACNQLHVMNAMNTLPLPPTIPQYTFQAYNNQLVTQMDNLNRNQQQKDVN